MRKILAQRNMFGNILQPDECWMLNSRLCTVALRMNRQSKNAQRAGRSPARHPQDQAGALSDGLFEEAGQRRIFEEQCAYPGRSIFSWTSRRPDGGFRLSHN